MAKRRVLEETLARLAHRWRTPPPPPPSAAKLSAEGLRAVVDERLGSLERQLVELKGRVNGLLFLVAGTALAQVIIRLLG